MTTDSMAGAGAPPGRYTLGDLKVEVVDDRAPRISGTSYLAGSVLTMERAINNVIHFAGVDICAGLRMAGENARKLFPEVAGKIVPGNPADIVLFEYETELRVKTTWVHGEKIERSSIS